MNNYLYIIERIKTYVSQEIAHSTEDILDYIDDDREGNKDIIGELKEEREHWRDILRIIKGLPDIDLYMNWKEYGLYETEEI